MGEPDPEALAEVLAVRVTELVVELHGAIVLRRGASGGELAGEPVAAVFDRPAGSLRPRHRAGRPSPAVVAVALEAAGRARAVLGYAPGEGNAALPALALACFYVAEARRSNAFGLRAIAASAPRATLLGPDEAARDPEVAVGAALLRTWTRLADGREVAVELAWAPAVS